MEIQYHWLLLLKAALATFAFYAVNAYVYFPLFTVYHPSQPVQTLTVNPILTLGVYGAIFLSMGYASLQYVKLYFLAQELLEPGEPQ